MTDLSVDGLLHELLISKLDGIVFNSKSIRLIQQYLSNGKKRVKEGKSYYSWKKSFVVFGRVQSLIWLFSTFFVCDLFYFLDGATLASHAGDITPYTANKAKVLVIKEIEHFSEVFFQLFSFHHMKINRGKSQILFSGMVL